MQIKQKLSYNAAFTDVILTRRIEEIGEKHGFTKEVTHALIRIWFLQLKRWNKEVDINNLETYMKRLVLPKFGSFAPNLGKLKKDCRKANIDSSILPKRIYG